MKWTRFFSQNRILGIVVSSVCFGLSHTYSPMYMLATTMAGIVLAICFVIAEDRKESALILVSIVHGLNNLLAFGLDLYNQ